MLLHVSHLTSFLCQDKTLHSDACALQLLTNLCLRHAQCSRNPQQTILADLAEPSNKLMADFRRSCNDAGTDAKPSPLPIPCPSICFVPVFFVHVSVICYLHAFSRPIHQTLQELEPGLAEPHSVKHCVLQRHRIMRSADHWHHPARAAPDKRVSCRQGEA